MFKDLSKGEAYVFFMLVIIGAGIILDNTLIPWLHDQHRKTEHLGTRDHTTAEHNSLGDILLDTYKQNRALGKGEHYNQSDKLDLLINEVRELKQMINATS